jgi:DNA polymerase III sliding clamp (beta) subunit (PCNA family)
MVDVSLSPGTMRLKAEGKGAAEDEIDISYDGPEVTIGLNARLVLDALSAIGGEEIRFGVGADRGVDPVWFRAAEGDAILQVVMPRIVGQAS